MKKEIGIVGLGKMGSNLSLQLLEKGWKVIGYNRSKEKTDELAKNKLVATYSLEELVSKLEPPKAILLMLTAGEAVEETIFGNTGLINYLREEDIVVDAGNSYFKDSIERHKKLKEKGINFIDIGISGGPEGARNGSCLMVGGKKELFKEMENLFKDISVDNGYTHFEGTGAGHFVKMIHNGIEYGIMQAIAEGFSVMKNSEYKLDLEKVSNTYNHGSVIESKLIGWLQEAFKEYGQDLEKISGSVDHSGEGEWTVKTAKEMGLDVKIIEESFKFRLSSKDNPSYIGKILTALRNQFGGHSIK